jgi:hypothetical protein
MGTKFCCDAFAAHVKARTSTSAFAIAYAAAGMAVGDGQIVQDTDGSWATLGCCGGGCSVLDGMKFCPFCGGKLPTEILEPQNTQGAEAAEDTEEDDAADIKLARERLAEDDGERIPWIPRSSGQIFITEGGEQIYVTDNGDVWNSPDGGHTWVKRAP